MRYLICLLLVFQAVAIAAPLDKDLQEARGVRWHAGAMAGEDALRRVAEKADPQTALEVLRASSDASDQRVRALAQALMYRSGERLGLPPGERASLRQGLMDLAADPLASIYSRNEAFNALAEWPWEGDVAWWTARFDDPSLERASDRPLAHLLSRQPEAWTPRLIAMLGRGGITRSNAALALARQLGEAPRRDVAVALLPWLEHVAWAFNSPDCYPNERWTYVESLRKLDIPEAVPGLLSILEKEDDPFLIQRVARAMVRYDDPRIVPALRKRLAVHFGRRVEAETLVEAIHGRGGFTDDDLARALAGYARLAAEPDGERKIQAMETILDAWPFDLDTTLGLWLVRQPDDDGRIAAAAIRARQAVGDAKAAHALEALVFSRDNEAAHRYIVSRLGDPTLPSDLLREAVGLRRRLAETCGAELAQMLASQGHARGIAAVLLERPDDIRAILEGRDTVAVEGVLDGALMTFDKARVSYRNAGTTYEHVRLPVDLVASLARSGTALAEKARAYLVVDDSSASRLALESLSPGAWVGFLPPHEAAITRSLEVKLAHEVGKVDETIAFLRSGAYAFSPHVVLRREGSRWTLDCYGGLPVLVDQGAGAEPRFTADWLKRGCVERRPLTVAEARDLERMLGAENLDNRRSVEGVHSHGPNFTYLHATRRACRRVFLGDPTDLKSAGKLIQFVFGLLEHGKREKIFAPGVTYVCGSNEDPVSGVVARGDDVRVRVRIPRTPLELAKERSFEEAFQQTRFSWRRLRGGRLAETVAAPTGWSFRPLDNSFDSPSWLCTSPRGLVRVKPDALWLLADGRWKLLATGPYAHPVVDGGGRFVCVGRAASGGWGSPHGLVLIDVVTGRETRVDIAPADTFVTLAWVAARRAFLVYREGYPDDSLHPLKSVGPAQPEYRLLDPVTGRSEIVTNEVRPFRHANLRPLQPSGERDLVWAALSEKEGTSVGLYDTRHLTFLPSAFIRGLWFTSDEAWVDVRAGCVYVVQNGCLLRVNVGGLSRARRTSHL